MDAHILRIDLSQSGTDFEPTALEPGVPTIDRGGTNYTIMRRWFGDLVAEPEWGQAGELRFFIRDEQNGRLTQAVCQPATHDDLTGVCQADVAKLSEQLARIKPQSPIEQALHRNARSALAHLDNRDGNSACEGSFIKYREPGQPWRLVWCWGFRRRDHQPATAMICADPECKQLFLRSSKAKPRCPGCSTVTVPEGGRRTSRRVMIALAAVALIGMATGLLLANRERLGLFPRDGAVVAAKPNSSHPVTHPPGLTEGAKSQVGPQKENAKTSDDKKKALVPSEKANADADKRLAIASPDANKKPLEAPTLAPPKKAGAQSVAAPAQPTLASKAAPSSVSQPKTDTHAPNVIAVVAANHPSNGGTKSGGDCANCGTGQGGTPSTSVAAKSVAALAPLAVLPTVDLAKANSTNAIYEVKLLSVRATNLTGRDFQAAIDLEVVQGGRYRLVNSQGGPLGEWTDLAPHSRATLVSRTLVRLAKDDYELFVERERGTERRMFQAVFHVTNPN